MIVTYHRLFQKDLDGALRYYYEEGGTKLGDRFFDEVESTIARATGYPKKFHFIDEGIRRASLKKFPYHILFEDDDVRLKFLVLRHDKRHPNFGLRRR